jgi:hypothetical protein
MGRAASWCVVGLVLVLAGCGGGGGGGGGNNGGNTGGTGAQVVTTLGTPSGTVVSKSIDSGGGEIDDPGGAFTLTIPAGALAAPTDVSVTPVSNDETPWGSPAGGFAITGLDALTLPATMSIAYTGGELADPSADTLFAAMQDDSGKWWEFEGETWDGTSLTVTLDPGVLAGLSKAAPAPGGGARSAGGGGGVHNPSVYIQARMHIIGPTDMFVDEKADYVLSICSHNPGPAGGAASFTDGTCQPLEHRTTDAIWTVDDVVNGNSTEGKVVPVNFTNPQTGGSLPGVQYTAPHKIPPYQDQHGFVKLKAEYTQVTPHPNRVVLLHIHDHGNYEVEAKYDDPKYPVCANAMPTDLHDSVVFELAAVSGTDLYDVSGIDDRIATYGTPDATPWILDILSGPEYFTTTNVTGNLVTLPGGKKVVEVTIFGKRTSAHCVFKDPSTLAVVLEESGGTGPAGGITTFQFDPDPAAFNASHQQTVTDGGVPADVPVWHYTITEKQPPS